MLLLNIAREWRFFCFITVVSVMYIQFAAMTTESIIKGKKPLKRTLTSS